MVKWSRPFLDGQNLDCSYSSGHSAYGSDLPCNCHRGQNGSGLYAGLCSLESILTGADAWILQSKQKTKPSEMVWRALHSDLRRWWAAHWTRGLQSSCSHRTCESLKPSMCHNWISVCMLFFHCVTMCILLCNTDDVKPYPWVGVVIQTYIMMILPQHM